MKKKAPSYHLNDENISKTENPTYYQGLKKNILAFLSFHNLEPVNPDEMKFRYYQDEPDNMIYNRPYKYHSIMERIEEWEGFELELMVVQDKWDIELYTKMDELLYRLRWDQWPDSEYEPQPFDKPTEIDYCWHHTSITHNRLFTEQPIQLITLQGGFCYCS